MPTETSDRPSPGKVLALALKDVFSMLDIGRKCTMKYLSFAFSVHLMKLFAQRWLLETWFAKLATDKDI